MPPAKKKAAKAPPAARNKPASRARGPAAPTAMPQFQLFDVTKIRRYERNANAHPEEQIKLIARLMVRQGYTNPAFVDVSRDHLLCFGHGRLEALELIWSKGVEVEDMDVPPHHPLRRQIVRDVKFPNGFPVPRGFLPGIDCSGWSEEVLREAILSDNQSARLSVWEADLLRNELLWQQQPGAQLWATGFNEDEIARWTAPPGSAGLTDPDDAPPVGDAPVSKRGDVWLLGAHRLVCGDATDAGDVEKALGKLKPGLMVTDPPYGVDYDPEWRKRAGVASAGVATGKVMNDDRADWREAWALFPGNVCYVWHGGLHAAVVAESLVANKLMIRSQIIWVKTRPVLSRGHFHWQHEPAYVAVRAGKEVLGAAFDQDHEVAAYAVRFGATAAWEGDRKQSTVWQIEHLKNDTGHGTQKPVECMRRPIVLNSPPGGAVYEPFSGSGTTIIAGEMTGRSVAALELDPLYVDVAVRRWQAFTGKDATLEADGLTFAAVEAKGSKRGRR